MTAAAASDCITRERYDVSFSSPWSVTYFPLAAQLRCCSGLLIALFLSRCRMPLRQNYPSRSASCRAWACSHAEVRGDGAVSGLLACPIHCDVPRSRKRIGPVAAAASTMRPPCVTTMLPSAAKRRAAARAGSISGRHAAASPESLPPPATERAASLGQMVLPAPRACSKCRMACSRAASRWTGGLGLRSGMNSILGCVCLRSHRSPSSLT